MKQYEQVDVEIVFWQVDDVVKTSPGGIDFGKDENGDSLGWGE